MVPRDAQLWLKRLRFKLAPEKVRFFLVGEYGDESWRPHYHAILFGINPYVAGGLDGGSGVVQRTWVDDRGQSIGHSYVGTCTPESMEYVAGYCTKKMTWKGDPRLNGKYPEFSRMSLRPGIGASSMCDFSESLKSSPSFAAALSGGDVPFAYGRGTKSVPLGRYLRRRLRLELGYAADAPVEVQERYAKEMLRLLRKNGYGKAGSSKNAQKIMVDLNAQKLRNVEARHEVYGSKRRPI